MIFQTQLAIQQNFCLGFLVIIIIIIIIIIIKSIYIAPRCLRYTVLGFNDTMLILWEGRLSLRTCGLYAADLPVSFTVSKFNLREF